MSLDKLEIWVHDHVLKNDKIRHAVYGAYQRILYMVSPKIKYEGDVERITPDDGYEYLFGYYDKCPWSDDGNYILALRVKNASYEADSCKPADIVRINITTRKVEKLATTHSWNVQQGCMAQWLSNSEILYNDFRSGKYCAVILNVADKSERIIQMPVYAMSQDKKTALSLDFSRLHRLRPGYGYCNIPETTKDKKCPETTCIWKIDIDTGAITPLLKYTDFASFETKETMKGAEHKVNHLMISPDGNRFMVLHRWFQKGVKYTRLVTCNMDGTEMYNLSDDDFVSHCCWKNNEEILSYLNKNDGGKGYYLMKDKTHSYERCWTQLAMDGHPTYSYDGRYVVTDTYPDRKRIQSLYVMNGKRVTRIARVFSPFKYGGDTRCDLHPRWSKDGKMICFDASFGGKRSICQIQYQIYPNSFIKRTTDKELSIIIPMYNSSKTIGRAIDSVINQECGSWKLIIVDDGSTDNSAEIVKQYIKKDSRIKLIQKNNQGPGAARNTGIENAQGDYIAFLDSDDYISNMYVRNILNTFEKRDADVVFFEMAYENDGNIIRKTHICDYLKSGKDNLLRNQLSGNVPWSSLVKAAKLNYIKKNGISFSDDQVGEEAFYSYKLVSLTERIDYIPQVMYYAVSSDNGQHKKGKDDPWLIIALKMKHCIENGDIPKRYSRTVNSLAAKALSISLYRIAKTNTFISALVKMKKRIKKYKKEFKFNELEKNVLSKEAKIIMPFVKCNIVSPIYLASIIRK